ncbi:MAG: hypothetical protein ACK4OP_08250 [Gemmobacter sp.]
MLTTKKMLLTGAALIALAAPALAEELRGRVTETFGTHVTIEDRGTRWLIRLPEGAAPPSEGARVLVEGRLEGRMLTAERITLEPGPAAEAPGGPRRGDRVSPPSELPAGNADAAPRLPGVQDLTLRNRSRSGDLHWSGRLGEGEVRVVSASDGSVKRVTSDGAALPRPVVDRVLGRRLGDLAGTDRLASISHAEIRPRGEIVLRGPDATGAEIEIRFDRGGRLDRIERHLPLPGLERARVTALLEAAGYADIGWTEHKARHVEVEATNAYGDRVEVRINRDGQIDRERLLGR